MIQLEWGLFWFDDTPGRTLADKIGNAALRYEIKYGHKPTLCYVNPADIGNVEQVKDIKVNALQTVLPNCIWLGVGKELRNTKTTANLSDDEIGQLVEECVEQLEPQKEPIRT